MERTTVKTVLLVIGSAIGKMLADSAGKQLKPDFVATD